MFLFSFCAPSFFPPVSSSLLHKSLLVEKWVKIKAGKKTKKEAVVGRFFMVFVKKISVNIPRVHCHCPLEFRWKDNKKNRSLQYRNVASTRQPKKTSSHNNNNNNNNGNSNNNSNQKKKPIPNKDDQQVFHHGINDGCWRIDYVFDMTSKRTKKLSRNEI